MKKNKNKHISAYCHSSRRILQIIAVAFFLVSLYFLAEIVTITNNIQDQNVNKIKVVKDTAEEICLEYAKNHVSCYKKVTH